MVPVVGAQTLRIVWDCGRRRGFQKCWMGLILREKLRKGRSYNAYIIKSVVVVGR